jgi:hypothetical protein
MEFAHWGINPLLAARHETDRDAYRRGLVQRLADLTVVLGAAVFDAALPSGGRKTGTTSADRIINTAKPTRTSTTVTCHFRNGFVIRVSLSLTHLITAIQFPDCGETPPWPEWRNTIRIK